MKPDATLVLERVTQALLTELAPALTPSYRQAGANAHAMLLVCAREELDRAAARRVEENAALRALFSRAVALVPDPGLAKRLAEASAGADPSLRVADLEAANQTLRGLLIELHAAVEALAHDDARALEAEIWRELAASTERRRVSIAPG